MKQFFPVIHAYNKEQAHFNANLAKNAGADGIFLIDHSGMAAMVLDKIVESIVLSFGSDRFLIGVNYLGYDIIDDFERAWSYLCSMLWVDNAHTDNDVEKASYIRSYLDKAFSRNSGVPLTLPFYFFGGVHFKYQPKSELTIEESIKKASPYLDYITLSGPKTGSSPDINFIKRAFEAANGKKLAIASGISFDNVDEFLPFVDALLVASSIIDENSTDERFDPVKLEKLCKKIKSF